MVLAIIITSSMLKLNHLSHDQNTIHAEKGCAEMRNFHMAAVMFFTGHGIKARTFAHAEITHISQLGALSEPGKHSACSLMLPGPDDAPHWEMYDFRMGMGSCLILTCICERVGVGSEVLIFNEVETKGVAVHFVLMQLPLLSEEPRFRFRDVRLD